MHRRIFENGLSGRGVWSQKLVGCNGDFWSFEDGRAGGWVEFPNRERISLLLIITCAQHGQPNLTPEGAN